MNNNIIRARLNDVKTPLLLLIDEIHPPGHPVSSSTSLWWYECYNEVAKFQRILSDGLRYMQLEGYR